MKGPDQLLPATSLTTTEPDGVVLFRTTETMGDRPPVSVPTLLQKAADTYPDKTALAVKRSDQWKKWSYRQYLADTCTVAKAFVKLGLERHHTVGIIGFNAPEWSIAYTAAIFAGGIGCGFYTTNSSQVCKYIAENSRANIMVVEDEMQVDKVLSFKSQLPYLKAIVQYLGNPRREGVLSWEEVLNIGQHLTGNDLQDRLKRIAINQCCSLIYTSGTTGMPKVVLNKIKVNYYSINQKIFPGCDAIS